MGGYGSGLPIGDDKRTTVEECLSLDANWLNREGCFALGKSGSISWSWGGRETSSIGYETRFRGRFGRIFHLKYVTGPEQEHRVELPIELQTTTPNYGGQRWWLTCPLIIRDVECNRRVGKLYSPPGARYFGCRHCYKLTYTSCQESHKYDRVLGELGAECGLDLKQVKELFSDG